MDNAYYNFVNDVKDKLKEDLNGRIIYEVYPEVDTCIFKITFREFEFAFPVNKAKEKWIEEGREGIIDIANDFKTAYKEAIENAFFKTPERKERDRKARMDRIFLISNKEVT